MDFVAICKALGQPERYALFLDLLQGGDSSCCSGPDPESGACCVVDLTARHPLAQSTISHHLRVLADAGLVQHDRRGTYQYYRVDEAIWDAFRQHMASLQVCHGAGRTLPAGRIP